LPNKNPNDEFVYTGDTHLTFIKPVGKDCLDTTEVYNYMASLFGVKKPVGRK
jgi:hypothetical protein